MTLIRELIAIPERVRQGDFVLKLAEGVSQPEQILRDYVVTSQLADAFANALSIIAEAVRSGSRKAAYLHGSFGAGTARDVGSGSTAIARLGTGKRDASDW